MCQNARKMNHFEEKNPKIFWQQPPHPLPKLHPLCSNIVNDKTVTEMM